MIKNKLASELFENTINELSHFINISFTKKDIAFLSQLKYIQIKALVYCYQILKNDMNKTEIKDLRTLIKESREIEIEKCNTFYKKCINSIKEIPEY